MGNMLLILVCHCIACVVFYVLYYLNYIICYALYSVYCIICIIFYALHFMHCIICIKFYALYSLHCILCIVLYAFYSLHYKIKLLNFETCCWTTKWRTLSHIDPLLQLKSKHKSCWYILSFEAFGHILNGFSQK